MPIAIVSLLLAALSFSRFLRFSLRPSPPRPSCSAARTGRYCDDRNAVMTERNSFPWCDRAPDFSLCQRLSGDAAPTRFTFRPRREPRTGFSLFFFVFSPSHRLRGCIARSRRALICASRAWAGRGGRVPRESGADAHDALLSLTPRHAVQFRLITKIRPTHLYAFDSVLFAIISLACARRAHSANGADGSQTID